MTTAAWPEEFATETFGYLTTIGRRSGHPHRIEIWFVLESGRVHLMSGNGDKADWVKNIAANAAVTFEIRGESRLGTATVIVPDDPEDARTRELLVAKYEKNGNLASWRQRSLPLIIAFDEACQTIR